MQEQNRLPEKATTEKRRDIEVPPAYRENADGLPEKVYIPKPDGRQRPLGIPTVRDRVVQTAALLILEPIFEAGSGGGTDGWR